MVKKGAVHKLPTDFKKAIESDATAKNVWKDITSLARNEWTCLPAGRFAGLYLPRKKKQESVV